MVCAVPERQAGFSYLFLLFAIVVLGVALAVVGQVWHTAAQRDKEAELLYVGQEYKKAIKAYMERSPAGAKEYPRSLEDLLQDRRQPYPVRYLRRLYPDPITNSADWGLVKLGDRVVGVYSPSSAEPRKRTGFPKGLEAFEEKEHYADWKFIAREESGDTK